jgi:hypothetical protein
MYQDITKAELQLCMATLNTYGELTFGDNLEDWSEALQSFIQRDFIRADEVSEPSFTIDDLRKYGELTFRDNLEDWSEALQSFIQRDFIRADEGRYSLTEIGKEYVEQAVTYEINAKMLLRKIHSLRDGSADFILEWK